MALFSLLPMTLQSISSNGFSPRIQYEGQNEPQNKPEPLPAT